MDTIKMGCNITVGVRMIKGSSERIYSIKGHERT